MFPTDNSQAPWRRQIAAARHLLVVQFWSAIVFLLIPPAMLLVWFAAPVRQPTRLDGIPWPPTDDWLQIFLMPILGLVILVVMGVWGLVTSLPWASARWLWLVVGSAAWLAAGYCFPSVGSFNGMLGLFTERRGALVMLFWLLGQGAIYLAWPIPDANWLEPVAKTSTRLGRQPVALVFALICWLSAASFWAMAYWLYVDPILGTAQFPYTHVVLICFLMALAEGLGLVWRYRQLRAYAGYHLLKEAQP